jgi:hypothetical protein
MTKRRPTRRDLLIVIGRLQDQIGVGMMLLGDDRHRDGFELGMKSLRKSHDLCIEARSQEPPILHASGPWATEADKIPFSSATTIERLRENGK